MTIKNQLYTSQCECVTHITSQSHVVQTGKEPLPPLDPPPPFLMTSRSPLPLPSFSYEHHGFTKAQILTSIKCHLVNVYIFFVPMQESIYVIDLKNKYLTCRKIYGEIHGCRWLLVSLVSFK